MIKSYHVKFRYDFFLSQGVVNETEFRNAWVEFAHEEFGYQGTEHHLMINQYIDDIAQALSDLNGGVYSADYYKALVWEGLEFWWPDAVPESTQQEWKDKYNEIKDLPLSIDC